MKAGDIEKDQVMFAGKSYTVTKTMNKMEISSEESDAVAEFQYYPEEDAWYLMNGQEKQKLMKNTKKMMKAVVALH